MAYHLSHLVSLKRYINRNREKIRIQRRKNYLKTQGHRCELGEARRRIQKMQIRDVISQNKNDPDSLFFGLSLKEDGCAGL